MNVMLLHAWPPDETMWEPQVPALESAGFRPFAPRLYGRNASIDGWAARLLDELDGPFVAVGASMGGYCALALARRAPERVVGMVLAGSKAGADDMRRRVVSNRADRALAGEGRSRRSRHRGRGGASSPSRRRRCATDSTSPAWRRRSAVRCSSASATATNLVSVDEARALAASAIRGSLEIFEGAGHLLTLEQPERFNSVLLEFLEQWQT